MRHAPRSCVLGRPDMPAYPRGLRPWLAARAACHPPWPLSGQALNKPTPKVPSRCVTAVLFTCAGQRVDIVTAFARAGATTIAVDCNELAPALYHADRRAIVPRVDDPGYVDALRELVALHDVRLVVPLTDLDGALLATADLSPAVALVSS